MKLLTTNTKLLKDSNYTIFGLSLAPHKHSGYNVCPEAGACSKICTLWYRGMTVQNGVRNAMIRRAKLFFEQRDLFLEMLHSDLALLNKKAKPACRLNVASDLPWEKIDPTLFDYKNIVFYDYTKVFNRAKAKALGQLPDNYHITYSWSERSDKRKTNWLIKNGVNINMVVNVEYNPQKKKFGKIPDFVKIGTKTWNTVDGDIHDARLPNIDGFNKVVCVRAKVKNSLRQEYINSGFIVDNPFKV